VVIVSIYINLAVNWSLAALQKERKNRKDIYMNFDTKFVEQVRSSDVIDFLEKRCGVTFERHYGAYRCKQHPSLAVKNDRLSFYWHSKAVGGHGVLDYLIKVENLPFPEAMKTVTGFAPVAVSRPQRQPEQLKSLSLPPKARVQSRLFDYLCNKRGIDVCIVNALVSREAIYEDRRGNVIFVGYDEQGKPRFACIRGTYGVRPFRMDCSGSDKRYAFFIDSSFSNKLFILESAIDVLSRASLENIFCNDVQAWLHSSFISLAGTSDTALHFFLNKHHTVKELVFCLDSDDAGQKASAALVEKYKSMGFFVRSECPCFKDCNEDLLAILKGNALC